MMAVSNMQQLKARVERLFQNPGSYWGEPRVPNWKKRYDLNQVQKFEAILNRFGFSIQRFHSILDFGCGPGRLTRTILDVANTATLVGCDPVARHVAECQRAIPRGTFLVSELIPPLPFPDQTFDFVFSYSVFTHLTEQNHQAWLKELARVLQPNGVMLHTTHSLVSLKRMALFSPWVMGKYQLPSDFEAFLQTHPYYYVVDNGSTPEYGLTVIQRGYVVTHWPRISGLRLLDYEEAAIEAYPEGCQDVVVLWKPQ